MVVYNKTEGKRSKLLSVGHNKVVGNEGEGDMQNKFCLKG